MSPLPVGRRVLRPAAPAVLLVVLLAGCGGADPPGATPPSAAGAGSSTAAEDVALPSLRDELLQMRRDDQAERTGEGVPPGTPLTSTDASRTARLQEIIAEHGWPTVEMVGVEAATGAWLVAQHSDADVAFQARAVELVRPLVAAGQADPTELAHLEDRVAVNRGEPQRYGTQIRCRAGVPDPATPLQDPAAVDVLRAEVGLGPLAEYYDELAPGCREEAAAGGS